MLNISLSLSLSLSLSHTLSLSHSLFPNAPHTLSSFTFSPLPTLSPFFSPHLLSFNLKPSSSLFLPLPFFSIPLPPPLCNNKYSFYLQSFHAVKRVPLSIKCLPLRNFGLNLGKLTFHLTNQPFTSQFQVQIGQFQTFVV